MEEITILFRDDIGHEQFNRQILSFLHDKHQALNQNGFIVRPIIVGSTNIDKYAKLGVQSLPALLTSNDTQENGVNNIIMFLSLKSNTGKPATSKGSKHKFQNLIQEVSHISLDELKKEESDGVGKKDVPNLDILTQDDIMAGTKKFDYVNKKTQPNSNRKMKQGTIPSNSTFKEQDTKFQNMDKDEIHVMQQYLNAIESDEEEHYQPDYN